MPLVVKESMEPTMRLAHSSQKSPAIANSKHTFTKRFVSSLSNDPEQRTSVKKQNWTTRTKNRVVSHSMQYSACCRSCLRRCRRQESVGNTFVSQSSSHQGSVSLSSLLSSFMWDVKAACRFQRSRQLRMHRFVSQKTTNSNNNPRVNRWPPKE